MPTSATGRTGRRFPHLRRNGVELLPGHRRGNPRSRRPAGARVQSAARERLGSGRSRSGPPVDTGCGGECTRRPFRNDQPTCASGSSARNLFPPRAARARDHVLLARRRGQRERGDTRRSLELHDRRGPGSIERVHLERLRSSRAPFRARFPTGGAASGWSRSPN